MLRKSYSDTYPSMTFSSPSPAVQSSYSSSRRDVSDDYQKCLKVTTNKEYFALLQHPHYYQNISELSYESTASTDLTQPSPSLK